MDERPCCETKGSAINGRQASLDGVKLLDLFPAISEAAMLINLLVN